MDYEPIDLTPFANADDDIETPGVAVWRGKSVLRGLAFCLRGAGRRDTAAARGAWGFRDGAR